MDILFDLLIIFIVCMYFGLKDDNAPKENKKKPNKIYYSKIINILVIFFLY